MAMILQVIFAVCCFVEMISAGPIPANTTIELLRLNRTLFAACGKIMVNVFFYYSNFVNMDCRQFICLYDNNKEDMEGSIHSGINIFSNMSSF